MAHNIACPMLCSPGQSGAFRIEIIDSDTKFYVVGGPVQPGRESYLYRNADAELYERLEDGQYCHILAQRQSGKTSLIANTAARLRKKAIAIAIVDLTQASDEGVSENAGRWYYSIAYRIVRELRIKADVQAWWKDRGGLTNLQRLREFFLEIVLAESDGQVVICLDRIEATIGQPLAQDLFNAVRSCHDARATQVDFQRLTFALVGSASASEIVKNVQGSIFEISRSVALTDFSPQELSGLVTGLGSIATDPEAIIARVWRWTCGHPYLSQKVMRGLARRAERNLNPGDVDDMVRSQFLARNALREEPHLMSIAEQLLRGGAGKVPRLNLYGRIRKGIEVMAGADTGAQHELVIGGVIAETTLGELRVRNEIYALVFDARWVNQNLSFSFKGFSTAAIVVLALLVVPIWYTEYLPRPYVQALSATTTDYPAAMAAHQSLANIPGYTTTADRLLGDFLTAKSKSTLEYSQMLQPLARLRLLPDGEASADELVADFWGRKSRALMHAGDRDGAMIALLESLQQDTPPRRRELNELVGDDYERLLASWHSEAPLSAMVLTKPEGAIAWLDRQNNLQIWQLRENQLIRSARMQFYSEEQPDLVLRAMVTRSGSRPRLTIRTNHPRPEQVIVNMQAPSGQRAALSLRRAQRISNDSFRFDFSTFTRLQDMRGAELVGNWMIAISDIEKGISGDLLAWSLDFAEARRPVDSVLVKQPIPEPRPSENTRASLAQNGKWALSWPANATTRGPVLVWDIDEKSVVARIPRGEKMLDARLIAAGDRVVTIEPRRLLVWNALTGKRLGTVMIDEISDSRVSFSGNGRYIAVRKLSANNATGIVVWDLLTLRQISPVINVSGSGQIVVDNNGQNLAVAGREPWARIWSVRTGKLLHEYEHISPPRQLAFDDSGQWLASDDRSNTFRLWRLGAGLTPVAEREGNSPWQFDFSADSSRLLVGSIDRAYELLDLPSGAGAGVYLWHSVKNTSPDDLALSADIPGPLLLASKNLAVTSDGAQGIKVWKIPAADSITDARSKSLPSGARAALSRDGKRIAVGEQGGRVRIHAVGAPGSVLLKPYSVGQQTSSAPVVMRFSPDRSLLATATMDGGLRLWDTTSGQSRAFVVEHSDGAVHDIAFASSGTQVISASRREVLVTSATTGKVAARLRVQANHPQIFLTADSAVVFIADDQGGVTRWDWQLDSAERIIAGSAEIRQVAASPDGSVVITAGIDRFLRLWDVESRTMLPEFVQLAGKVDAMWVTADGQLLIVHAGHWLHSIAIYPAGLAMLDTRLLPAAPAAVQPMRDGSAAHLLLAAGGRPIVIRQPLSEPAGAELSGDPGELRAYWRRRLALSISADGLIEELPQ